MNETPVDRRALYRELRILAFAVVAFLVVVYGIRVLILTLHETAMQPAPVVIDESVSTEERVDGKPARELTGSVVSIAEDSTSVRLAVPREGIYSVRVDEYPAFIAEVQSDPSTQFTVLVTQEPPAAPHDYVLKSFHQVTGAGTVEERLADLEALAGKQTE